MGSMDKKTVIFPKNYANQHTEFSLYELDPNAQKDETKLALAWAGVTDAIADDLAIMVNFAKTKKTIEAQTKRPEMVDPYVKVGVVGSDLVFRVKQKRSTWKGGDIEVDEVLLKGYAAEKAKRAARLVFKTKHAIDILLENQNGEPFKAFQKHCKERAVEENLDFMIALEELKEAKGKFAEVLKKDIYNTYVPAGGAKEINIPDSVRKKYAALVKADKWAELKFDEARGHMVKILDDDTFHRTFSDTADYRRVFGLPEGCKVLPMDDAKKK
jgi:hypothetical protein